MGFQLRQSVRADNRQRRCHNALSAFVLHKQQAWASVSLKAYKGGWNREHFNGFPLQCQEEKVAWGTNQPATSQWKTPVVLILPIQLKPSTSAGVHPCFHASVICACVFLQQHNCVGSQPRLTNVWCGGNSLESTPDCVCEWGAEGLRFSSLVFRKDCSMCPTGKIEGLRCNYGTCWIQTKTEHAVVEWLCSPAARRNNKQGGKTEDSLIEADRSASFSRPHPLCGDLCCCCIARRWIFCLWFLVL